MCRGPRPWSRAGQHQGHIGAHGRVWGTRGHGPGRGRRKGEAGRVPEGPELMRPLAELGGVGHGQQGVRERGREGGQHGYHGANVEGLDWRAGAA